MESKQKKLGKLLVANKIITPEQLEIALTDQKRTGEILGITLLRLGFVDEESVYLPTLAQQFGVEFIHLKDKDIPPQAISKIPAKIASHYKVIPVDFKDHTLTLAMAKPLDIHVIDEVGAIANCRLKPVLASEKDILETIRKYYGVGAETIEKMMDSGQAPKIAQVEDKDIIDAAGADATISKFLNQILLQAHKDRATDIHIEPFEDELKIRYRVDGVLYDAKVPANIRLFKDAISTRIKILSNLNIGEKRVPKDGRFSVKVGEVRLDLRFS